MERSLSVPKNVTLAFSYNNKTRGLLQILPQQPVLVDFEGTLWHAVIAKFPEITTKGCTFHYS